MRLLRFFLHYVYVCTYHYAYGINILSSIPKMTQTELLFQQDI